MRRVVYSPKVYAYVHPSGHSTPLNISQDVVRGSVTRRVNQVSSCELEIRNTHHKYTKAGNPTFRPMDPITVYLTRLPGHPVQVFTGFLDTTPYIQLLPGTVTLKASCTLKRLLYTYWDPALPYIGTFMRKYGWFTDRTTGTLYNKQAAVKKVDPTDPQINDGGVGALLLGVMKEVGDWDDRTLFIEQLPDAIPQRVEKLLRSMQPDVDQIDKQLEDFFHKIIGSASSGGATPTGAASPTGQIAGLNNIIPIIKQYATTHGVDPRIPITIGLNESGLGTNMGPNYMGMTGYYQWDAGAWGFPQTPAGSAQAMQSNKKSAPGSYQNWGVSPQYLYKDCKDLGVATDALCIALRTVKDRNSGFSPLQLAAYAQGIQHSPTDMANYESWWPSAFKKAGDYLSQYGNAPAGPHDSGPSSNANHVKAKHKKAGNTTTSGTYVSPFSALKNRAGLRPERTDQGVDYACAQGEPLVAIGDGTCTGIIPGWFQGQPFMWYQLTSGDHAGQYVYYAEGITPKVKKGDTFKKGDVIAVTTSQPTGMEFGFATVNGSVIVPYGTPGGAADNATAYQNEGGKRFARFIRSLGETTKDDPGPGPGDSTTVDPIGTVSNSTSTGGNEGLIAQASAFATLFNFPNAEQQAEAQMLQGQKSLLNDQPLFPFIEQLAQGSMRSFQSLPNGAFFAFFPDYFGAFGRKPYWSIDDIEILDGKVELSDDALVTHMYVVGDTLPLLNGQGNEFQEILTSRGVVNVFNAGAADFINESPGKTPFFGDKGKAIDFLKRYGARPHFEYEPLIRSPYMEIFVAFQKFMLAWSRQFLTTFTFTFMPELYPGGLVEFPQHGIQCYIDEVYHEFDYENGFVTQANLSAPSALKNNPNPVSNGMILQGSLGT